MSRRALSRLALSHLALALPAALLAACSGAPRPAEGTGGPVRLDYGPDPSQFGELTLPAGDGPVPVVMVVHGGFWRNSFGAELGRPLAVDLANHGFAAWNVEYRRVGGGGGWTATFDDVAAALDRLADAEPGPDPARLDPARLDPARPDPARLDPARLDPARLDLARLDLDRVVAVGHSAGGHLAAWLAARPGLPAGAPGAGPRVRLRGAVSQAGVLDLVDAVQEGVGGAAVTDLLGGPPEEFPDRYALASPVSRLPIGVPVVCVHGTDDRNVPIRQSERFTAASGDELVTLPGVDHFAVIDPSTAAWRACREAAARLAG